MEVHYKFKSAKDFDSIPIDWHYTTVSDIIQYIFEKKCSGKRSNTTNFDVLILTNAQTNEEYLDGETLIPTNTSLIVRRAPNRSCLPIVVNPPPVISAADQEDNLLAGNKLKKAVEVTKNNIDGSSVPMDPQESEWEEFWDYLSPPKIVDPVQDASPSTADEDSKIRALISTPALDWWQGHNTTHCSSGAGRGFRRGGMGGRSGDHGFGRGGLLDQMTPPSSYVCRRCKVPGHFIQHCPTNGDPMFDVKRTKPPTGIPHSMLMAAPDGSYALPNGDVAVLNPNEAAFEKEIQGIPSTRSVSDLPAELYCSLCRAVMKDAVLASKCCFKSFCDKCIRDYIISNKLCICGDTKVLADDLLPNKTLRATIVRFLESSNCPGAKFGGASQPQVTESTGCLQLKIPSSTLSAASKGVVVALKSEGNTKVEEMTDPAEVDNVTQKALGEVIVGKGAEVSEAAHGCVREPGSRIFSQVTDEEMHPKPVSGEVGKKKKKYVDMKLRPNQDFAAENCLMPWEISYLPYWNGMPPKFDGFGRPYGEQMPFMGYGPGLASNSLGGAFHHDPLGAQAYTMPIPPPKGLAEFEIGLTGGSGPPNMSREESKAPKTTIKQKQDLERQRGGNMEVSTHRNSSRKMTGEQDVPSVKSKSMSIKPPERSTYDPEFICTSSKRKVKHDDDYYVEHSHQPLKKARLHNHQSELVSATRLPILPDTVDLPPLTSQSSTKKTISDWKHKASALARITSPEVESAVFKKRKLGSSSPSVNGSSHHRSHRTTSNKYHEDHHNTAAAVSKNCHNYHIDQQDYELRDDDRQFKRRPSTYESSPTPALKDGRHSRRWREKGVTAASIGGLSVY